MSTLKPEISPDFEYVLCLASAPGDLLPLLSLMHVVHAHVHVYIMIFCVLKPEQAEAAQRVEDTNMHGAR